MLIYSARQVIACQEEEPKPWEFAGRKGTSYTAKLAVLGQLADVATIKLKAKTQEELASKIAKYPIGKPADIHILEVIPVFQQGNRKASGYELAA